MVSKMKKHKDFPMLCALLFFKIIISLKLINAHDWNIIKENIQAIKQDCGEVCDTSENLKVTPGPIFDQVHKNFNCDGLFSSKHIDGKDEIIFKKYPPRLREIPQEIISLFTYQNRLSIRDYYFNQADFSTKDPIIYTFWTTDLLRQKQSFLISHEINGMCP